MKNFKNLQLDFSVSQEPTQFKAQSGDICAFECKRDGENIVFYIMYDFKDVPLVLTAKAKPSDAVTIKIYDFRIELYVNGVLSEEEWPCGKSCIKTSEITEKTTDIAFSEAEPPKKDEPDVLYTFKNAEGWNPGGNVFVGDCMPYYDDGRYHVIYLYDRHRHYSKWGLGAHQWAHISTDDFVTWQAHPMMVEITEGWEGSICTGSHIKNGDTHYLFYTVRMFDGSPAPIRRSLSKDGYHFEKDADYRFELSDKYIARCARDPKIIKDADGLFHMFITTALKSNSRGCLAHLVSRNLDSWTELEEPIYISPDESQPECPDYFYADGYYYLVFSHRGMGHYLYSEQPFSGWKKPDIERIPCESVPKAAIFGGKIIFAGFKGDGRYAGTMTFKSAHVGDDGQLVFDE